MRLLAAALVFLSAPAVAETNYEGEFVTHCLPTATCFFHVTSQGADRFLVEWQATDRTGQQKHCASSAVLTRGPFEMRPGEAFEEAISGVLPDGSRIVLVDMGDRGYMWTDGSTCSVPVDRGYIGMNGFYDRFYGDE